jgi:uncharacterized protein YjdB
MKVHEVDNETILLELEPTKHYQLWNKWDLYEHLQTGTKKMGFEVEDFPIELEQLKEYANQLKQNNK